MAREILDKIENTYYPPPKPRYRVRGTFTNVNSVSTEKDRNCTFGTVDSPRDVAVQGEVLETWDMVTPRFNLRSRAGEFIINPFRSRRETQATSGAFCRGQSTVNSCAAPVKKQEFDVKGPEAYWRKSIFDTSLKVMPVELISQSDVNDAIAVASTKAWEDAAHHSADILVDIAEIRQVIRMLRDPIQSTSSLLTKIQRGKRGVKDLNANDAIDYANKLWLQYRFGIRPLVSTVNGVVKALGDVRVKKRMTARGSYNLNKQELRTGTVPGGIFNFTWSEQASDSYSIRSGLVTEELITLSQDLGVDASGMLALPWELVPFSFVADWFANVGDFLGALAPYLTKSPLGGWVTVQRNHSVIFNVTGSSCVPTFTLLRPAVETRSLVLVEKTRYAGIKAPHLAIKPQSISNVLSDLRAADSWALLHQKFSKVFKP